MNVYDNKGRLPIHCCVQRKRNEWEETARFLRDAEFRSQELRDYHGGELDLDSREHTYNKTQLIEASEIGDLERVKDLVHRGANLSAQDMFGETSLHYAAENGHYEIVRWLVRAGADMTILDDEGRTPLACCIQRERREGEIVVRFLKEPKFRQEELERLAADSADAEAESRGSGFLWIDAICINQADLDERNGQVRIMPEIYSKASCVIVWLGHDKDPDSQIMMRDGNVKEIIRRVNKKANKLKKLERQWLVSLRAFVLDEIDDWEVPEGGILSINDIKLVLGCFLRCWFSRAWVIQELSLARKIRMFVGDEEFEWHKVLKFLCLLSHVGFFRSSSFWKMDTEWRMEDGKGGDGSEAWRLAEIRLRTANDPTEWDIVDPILHHKNCKAPCVRRFDRLSLPLLIAASWSFESKDPRDKIYAILSLAKPLPPEDQILIDYSSPVEDLYIQVAHIFLRGSGRDSMYERDEGLAGILEPLEGLSYVQDPYFSGQQAKMPELPTWVADLSNPLVTDRIWRRCFRAAKTLEPNFGPGETKGTLKTLGLELDVVEMIEPGWADLDVDDMPPDLEVDVESWLRLLEHLPPDNGESPVQMLFRTLCMDQLWKDCDEETRSKHVESFRTFMAWELARLKMTQIQEEEEEEEDDEDDVEEESSDDSGDESPSEGESSDRDSDEDSSSDGDDDTICESPTGSNAQDSFQSQGLADKTLQSTLQRLLAANSSVSSQLHRSGRKNLNRLRSFLGKSEKTTDSGAKGEGERLPGLNEDVSETDSNDEIESPTAEKVEENDSCGDLSNHLERQRTLENTYNTDDRRFLPSDDDLPAQEELSSYWCKFHGPACEDLDEESSFRFQMAKIYRKRCLFRTRGGRLGLGPQFVKPGDSVWLIAGSRTPYLLRQQQEETHQQANNKFRFLGEMYMHGVMYGEAAVGLTEADLTTVYLE